MGLTPQEVFVAIFIRWRNRLLIRNTILLFLMVVSLGLNMQETMIKITSAFYQVSIKKFQFLIEEFSFGKAKKKADEGVYRLIYQNKTTAVVIGLEWREQYIYVELFQLVNGEIQENPILINSESKLTGFNLEDLLALRIPSLKLDCKYFNKPLTVELVNDIVTHYSDCVRKYARDILMGDFSIFTKLDAIVKNRVQEESLVGTGHGLIRKKPLADF